MPTAARKSLFSLAKSIMLWVPNPITSGKILPMALSPKIAMPNDNPLETSNFFDSHEKRKTDCIKTIDTKPKNGPTTSDTKIIGSKLMFEYVCGNSGELSHKKLLIPYAVPDASAIGANALTDMWRNIASCANKIPANGALNPAEIAAATPPPKTISVEILSLKRDFIKAPRVAPKCTKGPYCPTDAPPAAEINATIVLDIPVFTSNSLSTRCAANIVSAGPCHDLIPSKFLTVVIKIAARLRVQKSMMNFLLK